MTKLIMVSMLMMSAACTLPVDGTMPVPGTDAGPALDCAAMYGSGCSQIVDEHGYPACECVSQPADAAPPPIPHVEGMVKSVTCMVDIGGGESMVYDLFCDAPVTEYTVSYGEWVCGSGPKPVVACDPGTPCVVQGPDVLLFGVCP